MRAEGVGAGGNGPGGGGVIRGQRAELVVVEADAAEAGPASEVREGSDGVAREVEVLDLSDWHGVRDAACPISTG